MASINVENVSIEYKIYGEKSLSLKSKLTSQFTGGKIFKSADDVIVVNALEDVSFQLSSGDRVGLVGHNGSGKTTLLRVLSGIYQPTKGKVDVEGQIGTIIDPGAGMNPELSGLKNIYLRGRVLGLSNYEIEQRIDSIQETAQLGEFINLPMKTYSAGMYARLAFAVSIESRPNILLIDEGLGAGDAAFQENAARKIDELFDAVDILVLASHSPEMIQRFCNKTFTFEKGKLIDIQLIS